MKTANKVLPYLYHGTYLYHNTRDLGPYFGHCWCHTITINNFTVLSISSGFLTTMVSTSVYFSCHERRHHSGLHWMITHMTPYIPERPLHQSPEPAGLWLPSGLNEVGMKATYKFRRVIPRGWTLPNRSQRQRKGSVSTIILLPPKFYKPVVIMWSCSYLSSFFFASFPLSSHSGEYTQYKLLTQILFSRDSGIRRARF